jgi:inhibitor of cysteine peptidase
MKRTLAAYIVILAVGAAASMAAACGEDSPANDAGSPTPTADTRLEDAPIDELEILILESFPVQYNLRIVSGLPSGCAVFDKAEETGRSGNEITVRVTNTMPADPNIACTAIYGTHESTLGLGSDFTSGQVYTVRVNDKSTTFTAQ